MTEPCKFESDIAVLKNNTNDIKSMVEKIFSTMEGKNGLVTKVELLEQKADSQPTPNQLRFYSSIGGGVVLILGLLLFMVVKAFM